MRQKFVFLVRACATRRLSTDLGLGEFYNVVADVVEKSQGVGHEHSALHLPHLVLKRESMAERRGVARHGVLGRRSCTTGGTPTRTHSGVGSTHILVFKVPVAPQVGSASTVTM